MAPIRRGRRPQKEEAQMGSCDALLLLASNAPADELAASPQPERVKTSPLPKGHGPAGEACKPPPKPKTASPSRSRDTRVEIGLKRVEPEPEPTKHPSPPQEEEVEVVAVASQEHANMDHQPPSPPVPFKISPIRRRGRSDDGSVNPSPSPTQEEEAGEANREAVAEEIAASPAAAAVGLERYLFLVAELARQQTSEEREMLKRRLLKMMFQVEN